MPRFVVASLLGAALLASAMPASAQNIYCTVVGATQGAFQTDRSTASTQIPVLFLTQEVSVPYDASTGQATGKRTPSPLTIVKNLDASSIQFFNAAVSGEVLRSVTCTFYRNIAGGMRAYFKIALTNAAVVTYKDAGDGVNGDARGDERERISFTYQKIELTDVGSSSWSSDDWTG